MEAGVLEYNLGNIRSLLLSSPKGKSSLCIEFCNGHQFSAPYRRISRIQVSTTERPDAISRKREANGLAYSRCPANSNDLAMSLSM